MAIIAIAVLVLAAIYGLHRAACFAEDRGWIYYIKGRGHGRGAASPLMEIHAMLEPSRRHVIEEKRRDEDGREESGAPPE